MAGGGRVSETSVKRGLVPSSHSLRQAKTGPGALTGEMERPEPDRKLYSVPVGCMLRSIVGVENGNSCCAGGQIRFRYTIVLLGTGEMSEACKARTRATIALLR